MRRGHTCTFLPLFGVLGDGTPDWIPFQERATEEAFRSRNKKVRGQSTGGRDEVGGALRVGPGVRPQQVGLRVRESAVTEGSCVIDGFTSGFQVVRTEGPMVIVEAEGLQEGQTLLEKEPGVWPTREQGQGSEGQHGDHDPEGEAQMLHDVEDVEVTGHKREEAREIDPEGLEDIQDPTEAKPGPREEAAESAGGDVHGSWSEVRAPGRVKG